MTRPIRNRRRRGVTLMELLIVVTLLGLMTTGMLFAIRIGLTTMERTGARFSGHRLVLGAERALEQQVAGIIPVTFECGSPNGARMLFFSGEPDSVRFVTSHSLEEAGRGYPRIVEYLVIPGERGEGVRLVLNEYHYTGPLSLQPFCLGPGTDPLTQGPRLAPPRLGPRPFVLADRLKSCRISYLLRGPRGEKIWLPRKAGRMLPDAIHFEMTPLEPDPSRLRMGPVTLPVRANRDPEEFYHDLLQ